ncbi:Alpha/beta hydrolase family protein [Pirellula sp. SH-Sr6A]|uniref:esterase/lipase family protein n=1 Tax=Pirellula sp. SH-Sr6A TaxID=1632865 RepID=UPI00078DE9F2|nr:lipase [Pirellula sp. SH-Sr6A]AMV34906.1 Alpha/beta hydrolase family protein [Pirellula sp. SH-Sr6A]
MLPAIRLLLASVFGLGAGIGSLSVVAQDQTSDLEEVTEDMEDGKKAWNIPLPTLGGKQFWTDFRWWNGWKVQYNSTLHHWRLLDPKGIRRAWGGKQAMLDELQATKQTASNANTPEVVVLLAHGLFRTHGSMVPIAEELRRYEAAHPELPTQKRECVSMTYASTRNSIAHHATAMRELLENLEGEPKIWFVGHSLGNIVFRYMIGDLQRSGDPKGLLPRIERAVMLGPPNNGSALAKSLTGFGVFETLAGSSGVHLGAAWEKLQSELGTPPCPFAIVIGDISQSRLQNPFLEGASDGIVTVSEATLETASEIRTFPVIHSFLMSDENITRATVSFLFGGSLSPAP